MSANDSLGSLKYLPAQVKHNAHGWQVEYHALDPTTGKRETARHKTQFVTEKIRPYFRLQGPLQHNRQYDQREAFRRVDAFRRNAEHAPFYTY